MKDDAYTELVADWVVLDLGVLEVDHFRSHEPRGAASAEEVLFDVEEGSQSEICDADVLLTHLACPEQDIFGLQIPMHDSFLVRMVHCLENSTDEGGCLLLVKFAVVLEVIHQVTTLEKLQNHVEGVVRLVNLVELDDVHVVEGSHDFDFVDKRFLET